MFYLYTLEWKRIEYSRREPLHIRLLKRKINTKNREYCCDCSQLLSKFPLTTKLSWGREKGVGLKKLVKMAWTCNGLVICGGWRVEARLVRRNALAKKRPLWSWWFECSQNFNSKFSPRTWRKKKIKTQQMKISSRCVCLFVSRVSPQPRPHRQ